MRPAETILLETILSKTILSETILVRPFGPDTGLAYGRKPQTGLVTPIAGSETSRMIQMGRIGTQKLRLVMLKVKNTSAGRETRPEPIHVPKIRDRNALRV